MIPLFAVIVILLAFWIYAGNYYHAESVAISSLQPSEAVSVTETDYSWFFDGPSDDNILVFYPGAKVEETAYAPLLRRFAEHGMDACLVKMPLRFAFFGINKADQVFELYDHTNRYIGGHSLGGAMAAAYASKHSETVKGAILLAAFPYKPLDDQLSVLCIYGSEDGVLKREKLSDGRKYAARYKEYVIEGGNHAQFGNYGEQAGDGKGRISPDEQQKLTVDFVLQNIS